MSIFDLHTAFTDDVNAAFPTLNAVKTNRPKTDLKETEDQLAFVSKGKVGPAKLLNKKSYEDLLRIHVIVIKRTEIDNFAEEDAVMEFTEDIRKFYIGRQIIGAENTYKPHEQISLAIYDYDLLDIDGQTLSVLEITFKEWADK